MSSTKRRYYQFLFVIVLTYLRGFFNIIWWFLTSDQLIELGTSLGKNLANMLYTQTAAAAVIRRVQVILGQTIFVSGSFESNYSKEKKRK